MSKSNKHHLFSASAESDGHAYTSKQKLVSSHSTAKATSSISYEEAYSKALSIAYKMATDNAQNKANLIDQECHKPNPQHHHHHECEDEHKAGNINNNNINIQLPSCKPSCDDKHHHHHSKTGSTGPTGSQGPTGPQGLDGINGSTGPTGSINILGSNTGSILLKNNSNVYYNDMLQVIDASNIQVTGNILPTPSEIWSLGSATQRWESIYVGNASVNVGKATVSADLGGIAYTENGFATPFINVGPAIDTLGAVGGWQVFSFGDLLNPEFDLVAQQNYPSTTGSTGGPSGPIYSLIHPNTFEYWYVNATGPTASPNLTANRSDGINFIAGNGITITPSISSDPSSNTFPFQSLTIELSSEIVGNTGPTGAT